MERGSKGERGQIEMHRFSVGSCTLLSNSKRLLYDSEKERVYTAVSNEILFDSHRLASKQVIF